MPASFGIPDPRLFPDAHSAPRFAAALYALAERSLGTDTGQTADALNERVRDALMAELAGDGSGLATIFAGAPSVSVARYLWRELDAAWHVAAAQQGAGLAVTIFAVPVVIVVGISTPSGEGVLPAALGAPQNLAAILRGHHALKGNETFALGNVLVAVDAIDIRRLPEMLTWQRLPDSQSTVISLPARVLVPTPLAFAAGHETVHLRFLIGSAVTKPGLDPVAEPPVGSWGVPFSLELSRQLNGGAASVLALPRAPQSLLSAAWQGRVTQREVSAQIFVSNAIRKLRGSVGEPSAVISAHRAAEALQGGELRLSLSSPFEPREAEGFRCPLYPQDRVGDVVTMLQDLLEDCRVTDVRVLEGTHADRDAATGLPLLFKADALPSAEGTGMH
jgi:hypothetical protein